MPRRIPVDSFGELSIPSAGMDQDTVPRLLPGNKASLIKNFLMDRPGILPMRGPLCENTTWNLGSGIAPVGQWVFDDKVLISRYSIAAAGPANIFATPSTTGGTLAAGTYYYKVTAITAAGETAPGIGTVLGTQEISTTTTGTTGSVVLTWSAVTGATGYRVYRGTASNAQTLYYALGVVLTYTDTNAAGTAGTPPTTASAAGSSTRDTWVAPYRKVTAAASLRGLSATSRSVDLLNNSSANLVAATADGVPGRKGIRVGAFVYGHGGDATATVTQNGAVYKKTKLLRWDGSATPVVYTNGPQAAQDITYHYNRLIVLGGIAQSGTAIQFNSLYWTVPFAADAAALPDTAASWQDTVSGLVNQLVVGSDDGSDFGVAVAHVGANLCIFKRRSMLMLYGTTPSNWTVKQVSGEVGCIDPASVVEYGQGVYFMSSRGFMFYDGTRLQNVSGGLNSTLVTNAYRRCGPAGVDGGYVRATQLGPGYILVTTGVVDPVTLATTQDTDAWLLYAPMNAWTQLSSSALTTITAGGATVNYPYLLGDQSLVRASYLFSPPGAPTGQRGFDSVDGNVTKFIIPSRWTTRALSMATPPRKSKLQRITADYYWGLANGGWQVTTTTRGVTGVATSVGTLAAPTGIAATLPARGAINVFNETDEVYLDIAASSSAPATFNDAELHRVLVESVGTAPVPAAL